MARESTTTSLLASSGPPTEFGGEDVVGSVVAEVGVAEVGVVGVGVVGVGVVGVGAATAAVETATVSQIVREMTSIAAGRSAGAEGKCRRVRGT